MRLLTAISISLLLLSACGMKGPLYLPPPDAEQTDQSQTQAPADNEEP